MAGLYASFIVPSPNPDPVHKIRARSYQKIVPKTIASEVEGEPYIGPFTPQMNSEQ